MRRPDPNVSDLEKSWRQTVRWLVSDVPQRLQIVGTADGDAIAAEAKEILGARQGQPQGQAAPAEKKFNDRARRPAPKPIVKPSSPAPRPPAEKPLTDAEKLFAPRAKKRRH